MLQDKRIAAIAMFCDFFKKDGKAFLNKLDVTQEKSLYFDVSTISQLLPFPDFIDTLRTRPNEVIGCLGCAISILKTKDYSSNLSEPFCIWPRFQNFKEDCSFSDLKSGSVGQLVCIRGYVVKVSPCRPLIEGVSNIKLNPRCSRITQYAPHLLTISPSFFYFTSSKVCFTCSKCLQKMWITFEDGVFDPPDECRTPKYVTEHSLMILSILFYPTLFYPILLYSILSYTTPVAITFYELL